MELQDTPLPDWALGLNQVKELEVGTQLLTKDGRRVGNARIEAILKTDEPMIYLVRTDIGNTLTPNTSEIHELFYIGDYFIKNQREHNGFSNLLREMGESYEKTPTPDATHSEQ